jgi:hypothetical protein
MQVDMVAALCCCTQLFAALFVGKEPVIDDVRAGQSCCPARVRGPRALRDLGLTSLGHP